MKHLLALTLLIAACHGHKVAPTKPVPYTEPNGWVSDYVDSAVSKCPDGPCRYKADPSSQAAFKHDPTCPERLICNVEKDGRYTVDLDAVNDTIAQQQAEIRKLKAENSNPRHAYFAGWHEGFKECERIDDLATKLNNNVIPRDIWIVVPAPPKDCVGADYKTPMPCSAPDAVGSFKAVPMPHSTCDVLDQSGCVGGGAPSPAQHPDECRVAWDDREGLSGPLEHWHYNWVPCNAVQSEVTPNFDGWWVEQRMWSNGIEVAPRRLP